MIDITWREFGRPPAACGFEAWLRSTEVTDDPEGDLIEDLLKEISLPPITTCRKLRAFLADRGACREAISVASSVWRRYRRFRDWGPSSPTGSR